MVNRQRRPTGKLAWTNLRCDGLFKARLEPPSALKRTLGGVGAGGRKAPGYPIWRHGVILLVRLFFVGCLLVEFGEDTMHKMRPDLGQSDLMVFYVVAYILCLRFNRKDQVEF